eukprot:scaffold220_cov169-Amphora_coffeaeformis.AAC.35
MVCIFELTKIANIPKVGVGFCLGGIRWGPVGEFHDRWRTFSHHLPYRAADEGAMWVWYMRTIMATLART